MWPNHVTFALILCVVLSIVSADRPPHREYAKMARYLVHKSNWTAMGTISSLSTIHGFPMVNVMSIADSALNAPSTGHIYFLLTDLDFTAKDLAINNQLTALFTEDQDLSCTSNGIDTMEPTCARVIFTGKFERITSNSSAYDLANVAYSSRHPASIQWRRAHKFYFGEMKIEQIALLDFYGGAQYIPIDEYFNANYDNEQSNSNEINDTVQPSVIRPKWL